MGPGFGLTLCQLSVGVQDGGRLCLRVVLVFCRRSQYQDLSSCGRLEGGSIPAVNRGQEGRGP